MTRVRESAASHTIPISKGGQISLPAPVRRRWGTSRVRALDHGDHLEIRPVPDDPLDAVFGVFRDLDAPPTAVLMAKARADDIAAEERRYPGE
jgi:hypothetical protein